MLKEIEVSGTKAVKAQLAAEARRAARADKAGRSSAPRWVVLPVVVAEGAAKGGASAGCSLHTACHLRVQGSPHGVSVAHIAR